MKKKTGDYVLVLRSYEGGVVKFGGGGLKQNKIGSYFLW